MAIISIASTKGGVGKTSLAFSLAKDLGYRYATNDMSVVLNKYKNARYYPNKIPLHPDTVYDFGGFDAQHADEILRASNLTVFDTVLEKRRGIIFIRKKKLLRMSSIVRVYSWKIFGTVSIIT